MKLRVPRALLGWRKFLSDLWIVVLGVFIALLAEQWVNSRQWREQVSQFRQALRVEIAQNMGSYEFRRAQDPCVEGRIAELEAWLQSHVEGRPRKLTGPIGIPASLALRTSVWTTRTSDLESHMPLEERLKYAFLYDAALNNEVHRLAERETWIELGEFDGATELDRGDRMRLRGLINQARYRHGRFQINSNAQFGFAREIDIRPQWEPTWIAVPKDQCRSILPQTGRQPHRDPGLDPAFPDRRLARSPR
jgi:hypothetical protein